MIKQQLGINIKAIFGLFLVRPISMDDFCEMSHYTVILVESNF